MIIGINGRIGHGKDTVAKMIQDITGIPTGYILVDKDEKGNPKLVDHKNSPWQVRKFASALKQVASMLTGIPVEKFEDQEFKKTYLGKEWNTEKKMVGAGTSSMSIEPMTVRTFLQKLGTDAIRDGLHVNTWVNALMSQYRAIDDGWSYMVPNMPKWLITDVRFPNEAQAIKDKGGLVVRVQRGEKMDMTGLEHVSESSLDSWDFDYIIPNNGSLEELSEQVKSFLVQHGLLTSAVNTPLKK